MVSNRRKLLRGPVYPAALYSITAISPLRELTAQPCGLGPAFLIVLDPFTRVRVLEHLVFGTCSRSRRCRGYPNIRR